MAADGTEVAARPNGSSRAAEKGSTRARRAEVISVASKVFFDKGYRAATIQDLGDAMNFTSAALYYYVGSKHQILVEIVMEPNRRLVAIAEHICNLDMPATEQLRRIILEHVSLMLREREMFGVMFRERIELDEAQARALGELEDRYYSLVRNVLAKAVETREVTINNVSVATLALIGMINWTTRWYRKGGELSAEQIAQQYFDLFYLGVAPRRL